MIRTWVISDTHQEHWKLKVPDVDLIIHCGDFTNSPNRIQNQVECYNFLDWWNGLAVEYKILIGGNHDLSLFYKDVERTQFRNTYVLDDSGIEIDGIKFFGSSWSPTFGSDRWVFNKARGKMAEVWKNIPDDTEVLITHGPPQGILDLTSDIEGNGRQKICVGCKSLYNRIQELPRITYSLFGHIHNESGCINSGIFVDSKNIKYINASVTDIKYNLINNGYIIKL